MNRSNEYSTVKALDIISQQNGIFELRMLSIVEYSQGLFIILGMKKFIEEISSGLYRLFNIEEATI